MGLNKKANAGGVFLKILDGSIVRRADSFKEGFELYQTTNPSTGENVEYYIERFSSIDGLLVKFDRVEKEDYKIYGWNLHILDDVEMVLFLKDGSPVCNRVLKMLRSVDLEKRVEIGVWKDMEGKTVITFRQDGVNVPQHWNKENLPEPKKIGGKWNYSDQDAVLYDDALTYAETINNAGQVKLEDYREKVITQIEEGTYKPHPAEIQKEEPKVIEVAEVEETPQKAKAAKAKPQPVEEDDDDSIPF